MSRTTSSRLSKKTRHFYIGVIGLILLVISSGAFYGCGGNDPSRESVVCDENMAMDSSESGFESEIRYATGFNIEYADSYKVISVLTPWAGANTTLRYVLVSCGAATPDVQPDDVVIHLPVKRFVTTSTTQLPAVHLLSADSLLVGHAGLDFVRATPLKSMVEAHGVAEVGTGGGLNHETLLQLDPDIIFTFAMGGSQDAHTKLGELDLTAVINAEYTEKTPLGRAEWIKFLAAFLGKEKTADDIFNEIAERYLATKEDILSGNTPTAFSGSEFQGTWYIAGSDSYMGQFVQDAGASYVFTDTEGTLSLDFETIISKASGSDFWIGTVPFSSREDALASDERYSALKSVRAGHYAWYDGRLFEGAVLEPDVVLRDLVHIFHAERPDTDSTHYFSIMNAE